jgi:hypothetical protein
VAVSVSAASRCRPVERCEYWLRHASEGNLVKISYVRCDGSLLSVLAFLFECGRTTAMPSPVVLRRDNSTVVLEPYAPNMIRVTLSRLKGKAVAPPGYVFYAASSAAGWKLQQDDRDDIYISYRLVVLVSASQPPHPTVNDLQLAPFFASFRGGARILHHQYVSPQDAGGSGQTLDMVR